MLHCEHECVRDLATRPGRLSPMENYLPLHYDYLQFAYYQGEWFTVQSKELKRSQKLHLCQYAKEVAMVCTHRKRCRPPPNQQISAPCLDIPIVSQLILI